MYNKFFIVSILFINSVFGMEHSEDSSMTKINKWQGMKQFAGRIIAYKSNSHYICFGKNYKIDNDSSIQFGQVSLTPLKWADQQQGYHLYKVIEKCSIGSICALCDCYLSEGLWVRLATQEEIEKIKKAKENNQARWYP